MGKLTAMGRRLWPQAIAAVATLAVGYFIGEQRGEAEPVPPSFHFIRVIHPEDFQTLVVPEAPEVVELARRLGSLETAYN